MIRVEGLRKTYPGMIAVEDLSFTVEDGEILGLVGPNGAGKTTTLRALSGILHADGGTIEIAGHDIRRDPLGAKLALAYIPDTPNPYDLLTVQEHLRFIGLAYHVPNVEPRIDALLGELMLEEKRDAYASSLSRGMRQKLAIACAFLRDPSAVFLDEPLTGLDPRGIRDMRQSIRDRAAMGASMIVSSHMLELVERLCDRILIIHRGACRALGTVEEIREVAAAGTDASLEEIFFEITEEGDASEASS